MERSEIDFKFVRKVLVDILEPEDPFGITPKMKLAELDLIEPVYALEILGRLGVRYTIYTSGETLKKPHEELMLHIAGNYRQRETKEHFIKLSKLKSMRDWMAEVSIGDLVDIANYDRKLAKAA